MENERERRKYFKDLNRKVYIERACQIVKDEGVEAVSIRRMAKEFNCSSTSMYRYFENVEELLYYSYLGYLDEYLEELNAHEKEWKDIWDMHIGIWECYCRAAFRFPQAYNIIFFSAASRNLPMAIKEYYEMFPERINIVSPYLQVMLQSTDLLERDMVMARRCAESGVITMDNAVKMNRLVCLLYKGYLKDILDYGLEPGEIEGKVQEFKRDVEDIVGMYASDTLGHAFGVKK